MWSNQCSVQIDFAHDASVARSGGNRLHVSAWAWSPSPALASYLGSRWIQITVCYNCISIRRLIYDQQIARIITVVNDSGKYSEGTCSEASKLPTTCWGSVWVFVCQTLWKSIAIIYFNDAESVLLNCKSFVSHLYCYFFSSEESVPITLFNCICGSWDAAPTSPCWSCAGKSSIGSSLLQHPQWQPLP